MNETRLVIGMPAGSLADPNRGGNLIALLKHAGFPTKGYDAGGPTTFPLNTMLVGWDGRPQEFGAQLGLGEIDIAIGGDDWIRERVLEFKYEFGQTIEMEKVLSLQRGDVRIVTIYDAGASKQPFDAWFLALLKSKALVTMVSEMPYLALDWYLAKIGALGFSETHGAYSVQKFKTPPRVEKGLVIYETWGKTEAKVKNGAVDFGLEITQSGGAIRNYGLEIGEVLLHSETGIWVNPRVKGQAEKYEIARMFLLNLYGSIFAENKVMILFNAKKDVVPAVLEYLGSNKLFGDEPTMNEGARYTEFSVQMATNNASLPLAKVRYDLARMGATHIETIPLDSSIPGLDAIAF